MDKVSSNSPFHDGEHAAQRRAGAGDVAQWAGSFIRDYLPEQHRKFHTSLPFLVVSGADLSGQTWVTLIDGPESFIRSPDARTITLDTDIDAQDPLKAAVDSGTDVGIVGIELHSRRRNRFSGRLTNEGHRYKIAVDQTFGNCPQYIHERWLSKVADAPKKTAKVSNKLTRSQMDWVAQADTLFIGSGHQQGEDAPSRGYDASHRGGRAGFVHISDPSHLRIPDYAGNNFFNTIGNLMVDPSLGLVFVDFDSGSLLHIAGRAKIDWRPDHSFDPEALRAIDVEIVQIIERPNALGLRWTSPNMKQKQFTVSKKIRESDSITSFYLTPTDGSNVSPFVAGQHLEIAAKIPEQPGLSKRNYSLSGDPGNGRGYRISVKRESNGNVSKFLHDHVAEGTRIRASLPSGDFIIPDACSPLVLASAGVGITPMISMLHVLAREVSDRQIWFVHGTQNSNAHAFQNEMECLAAAHPKIKPLLFYSRPLRTDIFGEDFHFKGRINSRSLLDLDAGKDAHYLLCGPAAFLWELSKGLGDEGVPSAQIHFESFGPQANRSL